MVRELIFRGNAGDLIRLCIIAWSLFSSIYYLGFVDRPASLSRAILKTVCVGLLAVLPLTYLGEVQAPIALIGMLSLALALSAAGDFFLAQKEEGKSFVLGLFSFLLAHLAYLGLLVQFVSTPTPIGVFAAGLVCASSATLVFYLFPGLGRLKFPVIAYFAVIISMVSASFFIPQAPVYLAAGTFLFALSDSLIAVRKFVRPYRFLGVAVWLTYIGAQYLIVASLLLLILQPR